MIVLLFIFGVFLLTLGLVVVSCLRFALSFRVFRKYSSQTHYAAAGLQVRPHYIPNKTKIIYRKFRIV